jgi:FMN reductase
MTSIVGIAGGPEAGGRTATAVAGILAGAEGRGAKTELLEVSERSAEEIVAAVEAADAVVLGSPVYRATYSSLLKGLLEKLERGKGSDTSAPLQGKAAAVVLTGASGHHFLAVDNLRDVLAGFFAVQVLSPGLYLDHSAYVDRITLTDENAALTAAHGAALADLTAAVRGSEAIGALRPQV